MKTLKKTLCLILALALCFSLGTGAFAAKAGDFTDVDKVGNTYYQAVETLVALGVINGTGDNLLSPTATYTREEAAKIATYLSVGVAAAEQIAKTIVTQKPFKDVATDRWSAPYIAYCQREGIIDGCGDGTFKPTDKLTGYQWGKILLAVLGYGAKGELVGADWAINTASIGINRGVFASDLAGASNAVITRQQAILFAFNTMWIYRVVLGPNKEYIADDSEGLGGGAPYTRLQALPGGNTDINGETVGATGYYGTIAWNVFGVARNSGVVMANEDANLYEAAGVYPTALAKGLTAFDTFANPAVNNASTLKWSSDLDDLGEAREYVYGVANATVYSCVPYARNTTVVYENGAAIKATSDSVAGTLYYVNYDQAPFTTADVLRTAGVVALGDYTKYVDYNGDGKYEFALAKDYTQDIITGVNTGTKQDTTTTAGGSAFSGIAADAVGKVINLFKADAKSVSGMFFVYDAASVKGTAEKKNFDSVDSLVVSNGTTYKWSDIVNATGLSDDFNLVTEKIEYTFFLDVYGNIRTYSYPQVAGGPYTLVTEIYDTPATGNTGANQSDSLVQDKGAPVNSIVAEIVPADGVAAEYPASFNARYVPVTALGVRDTVAANAATKAFFYDAKLTPWTNELVPVVPDTGWTKLAAYSISNGVVNLSQPYEFTAQQGADTLTYPVANQYVGLNLITNTTVAMGQRSFTYNAASAYAFGSPTPAENYVSVDTNTLVYIVVDDDTIYPNHEGIDKVYVKTGFAEIPAVAAGDLNAIYALSSLIKVDATNKSYNKAGILVIETTKDPYAYSSEMIFNLSNLNKAATGSGVYNYVGADASVKNNTVDWANFFGTQMDDFVALSFYNMGIANVVTATGTKVVTSGTPATVADASFGYIAPMGKGFYVGTIDRDNAQLSSYFNVQFANDDDVVSFDYNTGYKVYKIVETETRTGTPANIYYTYNVAETTFKTGDEVVLYIEGGKIVYMLNITASTLAGAHKVGFEYVVGENAITIEPNDLMTLEATDVSTATQYFYAGEALAAHPYIDLDVRYYDGGDATAKVDFTYSAANLAAGVNNITVTATDKADPTIKATDTIAITALPTVTSLEITAPTVHQNATAFDNTGLVVTATYSDGSEAVVYEDGAAVVIPGYAPCVVAAALNALTNDTWNVTATIAAGAWTTGGSQIAATQVDVLVAVLQEITLNIANVKVNYTAPEALSVTGLVITAVYNDGIDETIAIDDAGVSYKVCAVADVGTAADATPGTTQTETTFDTVQVTYTDGVTTETQTYVIAVD